MSIFKVPSTLKEIVKDFGFLDDRFDVYESADDLICQDEYIKWFRENFSYVAMGNPIPNIAVIGSIGIGKSLTTSKLITEFENATLDNIEHYAFFVYPSIQDDTTIDDVASDILNRIVMSGSYNAKELGLKRVRYGYFKPFQSLKNVLATENIRICVVLDDFLADEKVSKILNDLRKLKRNGLSTLLISTEKTTNMSQFNAVFEMNPYSKDQLYDILKDAAKHVFHADTIDDEALQYCAEHVATNMGMRNGDLRKAQSILKSASIIAGHDLCKKVTKIHIEAVLKKEADKEEKRLLIMNKLNE